MVKKLSLAILLLPTAHTVGFHIFCWTVDTQKVNSALVQKKGDELGQEWSRARFSYSTGG